MYIAFFLVSAALGALQILEMRILSFSAWHYFAYIIIALAITGSAAAGAFFSVKNFKSGDLRRFPSIFSLVFGAIMLLASFGCLLLPLIKGTGLGRTALCFSIGGIGIAYFCFIIFYYVLKITSKQPAMTAS